MGLLNSIFGKQEKKKDLYQYFKLLNGYTPSFTTHNGGLYEMQLTRACIHSIAIHCSKLQAQISGTAYDNLQHSLDWQPNEWQTTSQFLYRVATILKVDNTVYIIPVFDDVTGWIKGYYPILPSMTEIKCDENQTPWLVYTFSNGEKASIEFDKVGIMTNHQYKNEIVGEKNTAIFPTLELIDVQNQGIINGIKNAASYRFYATSSNFALSKDLAKESKNFTRQNFGKDSDGAILLFPNTYGDVKEMNPTTNIVDSEQLNIIRTNVFDYFGVNDDIIQNKAVGDKWSAFFEGQVEPFAIQLSQVMTNMTYTEREKACGNSILWTASRVQTMTNREKLEYSTQMFDRGLINKDRVDDVWGQPHTPGGDKYYIRKEYIETEKLDKMPMVQEDETIDNS